MATKIIDKPKGINKKLGKYKFDESFEPAAIQRAEKVMVQNTQTFKEAVLGDFEMLKTAFQSTNSQQINSIDYRKIYALSFSIKSRAGNAGFKIASEVANSLYQFCDIASKNQMPEGYDVIRLHFNSLDEIFSGKFNESDTEKAEKLTSGLAAIAAKALKNNNIGIAS